MIISSPRLMSWRWDFFYLSKNGEGPCNMLSKEKRSAWKYPSILLFGIGVSSIGEWIYFIALNLIVLDMSGSPLAVTGLYLIKPIATVFTNLWAGSMVDRLNKRKLMVFLDIFRAVFIALLPFMSSVAFIYVFVFIIHMGSSIFTPTSMSYTTRLISPEQRKRFNSLHSLITSGAFIIGPAIAGMLFLVGSPFLAIYMNAIALFLSGMITLSLPDVEKQSVVSTAPLRLSLAVILDDWKEVLVFSRHNMYLMLIYFLFSGVLVIMASGVDSLEAAFAIQVLHLTDSEYGFLVSVAGAGILVGALTNSLVVKRMDISWLIGFGAVFVSIGYMIYAYSSSLWLAAIGFFVLAFFIAFANTGFLTFYQNNIPVDVMGRVGSAYGLIQSAITVGVTGVMGLTAHYYSIQATVIGGVLVMTFLSFLLCISSLIPSKKELFQY